MKTLKTAIKILKAIQSLKEEDKSILEKSSSKDLTELLFNFSKQLIDLDIDTLDTLALENERLKKEITEKEDLLIACYNELITKGNTLAELSTYKILADNFESMQRKLQNKIIDAEYNYSAIQKQYVKRILN